MRPSSPLNEPPEGGGDPWAAFGYLVAGVGVYGLLGWGLGVWLHASYLTPVGILVGAALGLVLVFYQFGRSPGSDGTTEDTRTEPEAEPGQSTDDRGESE
jgi:ATP synthase protein I